MKRTAGLRVELPVTGREVVVVGGGPAALGKIALLRSNEANVTVVAPTAMASIADLAERGLIRWHQRRLRPADLDDCWLVYSATGDDAADAEVVEQAAARQRFCLPGSGGVAAPEHPARRRVGGRVVLVGGGPGDPGLITVTGLTAIREADVVVHDRLAPLAVLDEVREGAVVIDVSKIPGGATTPQEEINRVLIEHASAGRSVVRLKGGDNFVFGRGGEEWQACAAAGIEVQIVPGVSSALAVPALAGIPLTHRTANQGFTVITGHVPPGDPRSMLDYAALARSRTAAGDHDGGRQSGRHRRRTHRAGAGSVDTCRHHRRWQPARAARSLGVVGRDRRRHRGGRGPAARDHRHRLRRGF